MFSLEPRCQGLCGSQIALTRNVALEREAPVIGKLLAPIPSSGICTNSFAQQVFFACLMSADTTVCVSLLSTFASHHGKRNDALPGSR